MNLADRMRQIFCRHDWKKVAFFQQTDEARNLRYSIRRYECQKCGRTTHRDSRRDELAAARCRHQT